MKSSIIIIFVALVFLFSLIEAKPEPADKYKSPSPAGICKRSRIKTNGKQIPGGSCSSQIQGFLPSTSNMVSSLIVSPPNGAVLKAKKDILVKVKIANLVTGFFADPETDYYDVPQELSGGKIKGHAHVTVQRLFENKVPDPNEFIFFQGLNEKAKQGELDVLIDGGLGVGSYRLCTMTSSEGHQPVIMPVAKRGAQDDCIRFRVK